MLEINRACIYECTFDNCKFYIRNICIYFIIYLGQFLILKLWKVFGKLMKKWSMNGFFVEEAFERWIVELCHHKRLIWMLSPYNIFLVKVEKVYSVLKFKGNLISIKHWIVDIVICFTFSIWLCPRNLRRLLLDVPYLIRLDIS